MSKMGWWRWSALVVSAAALVGSIGLVGDNEDTSPIIWEILYLAATVIGAAMVTVGVVRRHDLNAASVLVAIGVAPAFLFLMVLWFPPVALLGALAVAVSVTAAIDAARSSQERAASDVRA